MKIAENLERDFIGYGKDPPKVVWPNRAQLAVQLVVNFEEGGGKLCREGRQDARAAGGLSPDGSPICEIWGSNRSSSTASRVGIWRMLDLFDREGIKGHVLRLRRSAGGKSRRRQKKS